MLANPIVFDHCVYFKDVFVKYVVTFTRLEVDMNDGPSVVYSKFVLRPEAK